MLRGIKSLFRPTGKPKTGGRSSKTRVVPYRCSNEDYKVLERRADKWNGGNVSEYVDHQMTWILNRKHQRRNGGR